MKQLSATEQALVAAIDQQAMLDQVLGWAAINTGTANLDGLERMAAVLADAFSALPGGITLENPSPVSAIDASGNEVTCVNGRHLVLRVRPQAERRLLLTGHMDTVFPADDPFQQVRWLDEETINGPGTADMKGGIAVILAALGALEVSPVAARIGYDVLLNSDEETGSLSSAPLIAELARGKFAALTYEPAALPDGTLAHARGGSGNFSVIFRGRAAHAGRNPEDGRNALVAAADCAVRLKQMSHADLPINPARIDGGSPSNVVPDLAVLRFNIRPKNAAAAQAFQSDFNDLLHLIEKLHGVSAHSHGGITRPPKPVSRQAQKLFDLVRDTGEALGQAISWVASGGVCDGNNIAACGVPVVDTMGVRGGAIHSASEYMIVPSLKERAALSAIVLHRLAEGEAL